MAGKGKDKSTKDKARASYMKARGIVRTTGRCGCGAIITVDSPKSKYTHLCWSARKG